MAYLAKCAQMEQDDEYEARHSEHASEVNTRDWVCTAEQSEREEELVITVNVRLLNGF